MTEEDVQILLQDLIFIRQELDAQIATLNARLKTDPAPQRYVDAVRAQSSPPYQQQQQQQQQQKPEEQLLDDSVIADFIVIILKRSREPLVNGEVRSRLNREPEFASARKNGGLPLTKHRINICLHQLAAQGRIQHFKQGNQDYWHWHQLEWRPSLLQRTEGAVNK